MNIAIERHPKCLATLRVEIPADKVAKERARIVGSFAGQARLPGFRPGKVPRQVIELRFQQAIAEELEERLVREGFDEALRRENLRVLDFGSPKGAQLHPDGAFSFTSELVLAPDFELPEYKAIEIEVPRVEVSEEMVDQQLEEFRQRFAEYPDIEERGAETGDVLVIDYTTSLAGRPLAEAVDEDPGQLAGRQDLWLRLDPAEFLPGFAACLVGMRPGEEREVVLTMPADFAFEPVRERELTFQVKLNGLKRQVLPELDDALAARILPDETLAGLRDVIRERIQHDLERRLADFKVNRVIEHLNRQVTFELPEQLLTAEIQGQADAMVERGLKAGMSSEEISGQQNEIFNAAGQQAQVNLRTHFILQEIARAEHIEVSDRELLNHLAGVAKRRREPIKKLIAELRRTNRLPGIRNSLLVGKAIDFLVAQAIVREVAPDAADAPSADPEPIPPATDE